MVLVSYILDNHISILQTKLSNREGHEARRIRLEALPLDEHIEGRHGEREPGVKIRPDPMHDCCLSNNFVTTQPGTSGTRGVPKKTLLRAAIALCPCFFIVEL